MQVKPTVPLTNSSASELIFFSPVVYWMVLLETWVSIKALLPMSDYLRQCSPMTPGPWLTGAGAGSQATAESTAGTEVCLPTT